MGHLMEAQPVIQRQQIGCHGSEGAHEPVEGAIRIGQQHAGPDTLFVDV
jgi:hypothetical protein